MLAALLEWFAKPIDRLDWPRPAEVIFDYAMLVRAFLANIDHFAESSRWRMVIENIGWQPTPSTADSDDPAAVSVVGSLAGGNVDPAVAAATTRRGVALSFDREATEKQIGLDVDRYADSLAQLLSSAGIGEFALAIYGHWGRGKTFLVKQLEHSLEKRRADYAIVRYSAWQFPSTPEAWVHLYESFASAAFDRPWRQALPTIFRTALKRRGIGGFAWPSAMLSLAVVAIGSWMRLGSYLISLVLPTLGAFGVIWLVSWLFKVRSTGARLTADYLRASRHAEKLGLQATIGSDLKSLLHGWLPDTVLPKVSDYVKLLGPLFAFFGVSIWQLEVLASDKVWPLAMAALGLVAIGAAVWLRWGGVAPQRVLLIVDDLDRCKPEHLLAVVESIKLQLQDPQIAQRVQTLFLVEEDTLKRAILDKYASRATDSSATIAKSNAERIVREVGEKLFTAHLRLPPLAPAEAIDLLELFVLRRNVEATGESTERPSPPRDARAAPNTKPDRETEEPISLHSLEAIMRPPDARHPLTGAMSEKATSTATALGVEVEPTAVFSLEEKTLLSEALQRYASSDEQRAELGPRAIRALLFRYQLARLLLDQLKVTYETVDLADGLVRQCLLRADGTAEPITACTRKSDALRWVISQVC